MQNNLEFRKGVLFAQLSGKLTFYHSKKFGNYLVSVIMKHGVKYIVINLSLLNKIDRHGIATINSIIYAIKNNSGEVYVVSNDMKLRFRNTKEIEKENDVYEMVNI